MIGLTCRDIYCKWYYSFFLQILWCSPIGSAARLHWGIEDKVHWTFDVVFKEDDCRIRDETAALNFAWFRKMALALLKPIEPYGKKVHSIKKKMLQNLA